MIIHRKMYLSRSLFVPNTASIIRHHHDISFFDTISTLTSEIH